MAGKFEFDQDIGDVVYIEGDENVGSNNEVDNEGYLLDNSQKAASVLVEGQEVDSGVPDLDDNYTSDLSLSEYEAAVLALDPVSGALGSSTLDYFDRVVSGLPSDYIYIAYRTSSDSSYDGVLYFGSDFQLSNGCIDFGSDAQELRVTRVSSSGYNNEVRYTSSDVSFSSVYYDQNGSVLYYTNASPGFPVLGSYAAPRSYSFYIVPALIGALAFVVFSKLLLKR